MANLNEGKNHGILLSKYPFLATDEHFMARGKEVYEQGKILEDANRKNDELCKIVEDGKWAYFDWRLNALYYKKGIVPSRVEIINLYEECFGE